MRWLRQEKKIAIIGLGTFFELAKEAAKLLKEEAGINATVINPYYITGLDEALLTKLKQNHDTVITLEDGILDGGFGEKNRTILWCKQYESDELWIEEGIS